MSMTWGQLSGILAKDSMEKKIPLIGEFELTARCNLTCKMCYVCRKGNDTEAMKRERSAKEWIRLAREAFDAGMLFLLLTGGEVFLRKDFKTIYEEISMMGFNVSVYSNGTMITPQVASWLGRIAPSQIDVTLYGASPETYQKVCGDASGYERAMRGIELLIAQGINVQLRTTIVRGNVGDYDKLNEIAGKSGMTLGIVNYISPRREGSLTSPETERLSPKELVEFEKKISMEDYNNISDNQYSVHPMEATLNDKLNNSGINLNMKDSFPCSSGKNSFWVTWDGRMVPCSFMAKPETFPFEKGFTAAWEELKKLCASVPVCKTCNQCSLQEFCTSCPAELMNETGSFEHPAIYLCELAQERKKINYDQLIFSDRR
ncbi:MAG: radical SAM protein [Anaerocolumna sp.]